MSKRGKITVRPHAWISGPFWPDGGDETSRLPQIHRQANRLPRIYDVARRKSRSYDAHHKLTQK